MTDAYKIISAGSTGELIEKKSRFIATILPVSTEEEALSFIEQIRKKYWDARHNCYAYTIGSNHELERCSDDGEPSRTAGRPMLDVLLNEGLCNVCVVVTRYFGGTLLGTGGLVRAYQGAVKEGLKNAVILTKELGKQFSVLTDYQSISKIQYLADTMNISIISTDYTDSVTMTLLCLPTQLSDVTKKIQEVTNGKAVITDLPDVYFANTEQKLLIFKD